MPKITHVKRAQPRYETKPVIDPETGLQKVTTVMKGGKPLLTKHGNPVTMKVTARDLDRPKPLLKCGHCQQDIELGTPYKHMTPRSGPYGGTQLNRHEACPSWNEWDYSSSLSARIAQIQHDAGLAIDDADFEDADEATSVLEGAADEAEGLAEEKNEAADSLEEGFGHETYQSEEIRAQAEALEEWAEAMRSVDIPEKPEAEPEAKWYVTGPNEQSLNEEGYDDEGEAQRALDDHLEENPDDDEDDWNIEESETGDEGELSEDELNEWIDEVKDALRNVVDEVQL